MGKSWPRSNFLVASGIGMAVFLLFALPIAVGLTYFGLDFDVTSVGILCELKRISAAHWPVWISPLIGGGEPLFANFPAQILYPLQWVERLFAPEVGASVSVPLHLGLTAAGTFWLARTFRMGIPAALLAGIAFAFSGTTLDLINHGFYQVGAAWIPFAWASCRQWLETPKFRWPLALWMFSIVCIAFGGDPQSLLFALGLGAFEAGIRIFERRMTVAKSIPFALATLSALMISFVQLGPNWAESRIAQNLQALSDSARFGWSFTPISWLATILPGALTERIQGMGTLWSFSFRGIDPHPETVTMTWNQSPYLGLLWLCLLPAAGGRGTRRLWFMAGGALLLSLGGLTPFLKLISALFPPIGWFRFPSKYLVVMTLPLALLAGQAFEHLLLQDKARRRLVRILAAVSVLGALAAAGVWIRATALDAWVIESTRGWSAFAPSDAPTLSGFLLRSILSVTGSLVVSGVVVGFFPKRTTWLMGFLLFDLLIGASHSVSIGPRMIREGGLGPVAMSVRETKDPLVCHTTDLYGLQLVLPDGDNRGWSRTMFTRLMGCPNVGACDGIRMGTPYSALTTPARSFLRDALDRGEPYAAWSLGCDYVVSGSLMNHPEWEEIPLHAASNGFKLRNGVHLYRVRDPLPPVFVSERPGRMVSSDRLESKLTEEKSAPDAARIVDDPANHRGPETALPDGAHWGAPEVRWTNPSRADLRLNGTGGGVVGVKTVFAMGWHARQAGRPLPTVRIAGVNLGIRVEDASAGPVELEYLPPMLWPAIAVGMLGLVLALALLRRIR